MGWRGNAQLGSWLPVLSLSLLTRSSSSETRTVKVSSLCWTKTMWVISFCLMWDFLSGYCPSVCLSSSPLLSVLSTWSTWRSFGRLRPGTDCGASIRLWARTPTASPTWTRYTAQEKHPFCRWSQRFSQVSFLFLGPPEQHDPPGGHQVSSTGVAVVRDLVWRRL